MNRTYRHHAFISIIALLFCSNLFAQKSLSTQGVEFWLTYMRNDRGDTVDLSVTISARRACTGIISIPLQNWSQNFSVGANGITTVNIPPEHAYVSSSESIEPCGILVTSSDTVSVYAMNHCPFWFDATNILPTHALADHYMIQTYENSTDLGNSQFSIIATEDNTRMVISPSTQTEGGRTAPFTITLNRGEVYQVCAYNLNYSFPYTSLSGSQIRTYDNKKIAVFNGNNAVRVPDTYYGGYDHLIEQMLPTKYWGTEFAITATAGQQADNIRITALRNNTRIEKNGVYQGTIQAGSTYQFVLNDLTNSEHSCFIKTSDPVAVNLYLSGVEMQSNTISDPSMVWISPIEQRINNITFGTYEMTDGMRHYANIVTHNKDVASTLLNNVNISSAFQPLTGNSSYSFATILLPHGTYTLENTGGFTAHIYGLDYYESYSYNVGSKLVNLTSQILIDSVSSLLIDSNYCQNSPIVFESETSYPPLSVSWDFGDGSSTSSLQPITHTYSQPGIYTITMIVGYQLHQITYDTVSVDLEIYPTYNQTISADICDGDSLLFGGEVLYEAGNYKTDFVSQYGCDSTIVLVLNVHARPTLSLTHTPIIYQSGTGVITIGAIPTGGTYSVNGIYNAPLDSLDAGSYEVIVYSDQGCPSEPQIVNIEQLCLSVDYDPIPDICGDAGVFGIWFTSIGRTATRYNLSFDSQALQAGFVNVSNQLTDGQSINITLPNNIRPNEYRLTIELYADSCSKPDITQLNFTVLYPSSIMVQKWNNVIALKNEFYNGGYRFSNYQWYKNGHALQGENYSYIYTANHYLKLGDTYTVEVIRTDDGITLFSCPLIPTIHTDITPYPHVIIHNMLASITNSQKGLLTIWNTLGQSIRRVELALTDTQIILPNRGIYLFQFEMENGTSHVERVVCW